jgi:transcriptional regulator with XRE-family HTH domain
MSAAESIFPNASQTGQATGNGVANGNSAPDSKPKVAIPATGPTESSEDTIRRVLSGYAIGNKLRQLRLRKKIGLADLGKHTGLSASMLSQLENGKLIPTLPTLARIAMVFDVGVEYFFVEQRGKRPFPVVRANERMRFPDQPDSPAPNYFFEVLTYAPPGKKFQAYLADFPMNEANQATLHTHEGFEFVHVLGGAVEIVYEEDSYRLELGDSVYFDASVPHSYRGVCPESRAIVVADATTP